MPIRNIIAPKHTQERTLHLSDLSKPLERIASIISLGNTNPKTVSIITI